MHSREVKTGLTTGPNKSWRVIAKILWGFKIHTDRVIEAQRSDILVVGRLNSQTLIIDIAVPGDFMTREKEAEKIEKYQDWDWS